MRRFACLCSLLLLLQGCLHIDVSDDSDVLDKSKPTVQKQLPYWWWYGFGGTEVDVKTECAKYGGFKQFQLRRRFLDEFLETVTLGIYNPITASILCKQKRG